MNMKKLCIIGLIVTLLVTSCSCANGTNSNQPNENSIELTKANIDQYLSIDGFVYANSYSSDIAVQYKGDLEVVVTQLVDGLFSNVEITFRWNGNVDNVDSHLNYGWEFASDSLSESNFNCSPSLGGYKSSRFTKKYDVEYFHYYGTVPSSYICPNRISASCGNYLTIVSVTGTYTPKQ